MAKYLILYRVPRDHRQTPDTANAWETWFGTIGSTRIDPGHGALESRELGKVGAETRGEQVEGPWLVERVDQESPHGDESRIWELPIVARSPQLAATGEPSDPKQQQATDRP